MKNFIQKYLTEKKLAWADTTIRSTKYRLMSISDVLTLQDPLALWTHIERLKPYSRVTVFTNVVSFFDWLLEEKHLTGVNEYKKFRRKNAKLFKNAYRTRKPTVSYQEAEHRIGTIKDGEVRSKCLELLSAGLRYTESLSRVDGGVIGKGGKWREIFTKKYKLKPSPWSKSYSHLRRHLANIGLKPHDLRKLFLTELVKHNANEFELCQIAGWASITTASSYIKTERNRLEELVNHVHTIKKIDSNIMT